MYTRPSLPALTYVNLADVPDFEEKISNFINDLDEELITWRDYKIEDDKKKLKNKVIGYACLDGDKIIAINYWTDYKKYTLRYFIFKLFFFKEYEGGMVAKKNYQKLGITTDLKKLRDSLAQKYGYVRSIGGFDADNKAMLDYSQKRKYGTIKKTDKTIYYFFNLDPNIEPNSINKLDKYRLRIGIEIIEICNYLGKPLSRF